MKNIGLITFHESDNYGTCLQAFALQTMIENLDYNCNIINYKRHNIINNSKRDRNSIKKIIEAYGFRNLFRIKKIKKHSAEKKESFSNFRKKYFHYTENIYYSVDDLKKIENYYDAFVCGSDMIWTLDRIDEVDIFFMNFIKKKPKIAYAPSFGSSTINLKVNSDILEMLNKFNSLSCREKSGVEFINNNCINEANFVCDPTLLIPKDKWFEMFNFKNNTENKVVSYLFEGTPTWAKNIFNKLEEESAIEYIPMTVPEIGIMLSKNKIEAIGPEEFVKNIASAKMVITNSYHGLLFSIIFEKQFIVLRRDKSGKWGHFEERMRGILKYLGLENRIIEVESDYTKIKSEINYKLINDKIEKLRNSSLKYLKESLECIENE